MRDYKKKTALEVLLGHKDQASEKRLITPEQAQWADTWHTACRAAQAYAGIAAYGDRLMTAACSRSDHAGRSDALMAARMDQRRLAVEAARAVNAKFGKDKFGTPRAKWLASYLDGEWNPTNEAKRQHKRPQNIRIMLAEAIKEIADFYMNNQNE